MSGSDNQTQPLSKSKSQLDLSQPDDVLVYLAGTPFASTRVEPLSGGTANFIFRLYLITPFEIGTAGGEKARTLILKHAKNWVAANKEFQYDVGRQNIEATALELVRALLPADALVTVPAVYHHDTEAHVIIMEDAGPNAKNMKFLLRDSPLSEAASRKLGTALGHFLSTLHVQASTNVELMKAVRKNEDSKRITAWVTYGRLVDSLKQLRQATGPVDPPLTAAELPSEEQIAEITALANDKVKKIYEAQTVFTMGDFWTGNVVVRLKENGDVDRAFVIDWEVTKPGLAHIDFAQFTAEMHTLRRFHPEAHVKVNTTLNAFEEAYTQGMQVDEEFARSAASHVGAHMIMITPIARWGSKEKTREVIKEGIEYVLGGLHGDVKWLRESVVGDLLPSASV